jgi:hypothetical protein
MKETGAEMVKFAQKHATAIMIAPPPSQYGKLNTASGAILQVEGSYFLVTAAHVLAEYEARFQRDQRVKWQVGAVVFDPSERLAFRDDPSDVALFRLMMTEAPMTQVHISSAVAGWPPPHPSPGDFVIVSGYPAVDRQREGEKQILFNALSALFQVTTTGPGYFVCQWEREYMASFEGPGIPPQGMSLGGISGGPVFHVGSLAYPLVGIVSQFQHDFELLRIATLDTVPLAALTGEGSEGAREP